MSLAVGRGQSSCEAARAFDAPLPLLAVALEDLATLQGPHRLCAAPHGPGRWASGKVGPSHSDGSPRPPRGAALSLLGALKG